MRSRRARALIGPSIYIADHASTSKGTARFVCAKFGETYRRPSSIQRIDAFFLCQIEVFSKAKELDQILLRSGEKGLYEQVREIEGVRFPPPEINDVSDKISIIFQAHLAGIPLDFLLKEQAQKLSLNVKGDIKTISEHAPIVCRAMLRIAMEKEDGGTARAAFELLRCAHGNAWEGTQAELLQIKGIGHAFMETLGDAGITSIAKLANESVDRVGLLLDRSAGNAKKLIQEARKFPRIALQVKETMGKVIKGKGVHSDIDITVELNHTKSDMKKLNLKRDNGQPHNIAMLVTTTNPDSRTCLWQATSILQLTGRVAELPTQKILMQSTNDQVVVTVACDTISGGVKEHRVRPSCPSHYFAGIAPTVIEEGEQEGEIDSEVRDTSVVFS